MTYPIQTRPSFRAAQIGEDGKHSLWQNNYIQDRHLTVCSSIAAAASHHHEESRLIYGPLASILLDQGFFSWIWIRWIQYATHRNNLMSSPKLAMSTAMQNSAPSPSYFWATFPGDIHASLWNNQNHKLTVTTIISVLKQQTQLLLHYGEHISLTDSTMP